MAKVITQEMVQAAADKAAAKATAAEKKRCIAELKATQELLLIGEVDATYARGIKAGIKASISAIKAGA